MPDMKKEQELLAAGYNYIAGVDEAGRGPLVGPVVAACVILDRNFKMPTAEIELVKDSKKLSAAQREKIFALIKKYAVIGVGIIDHETIDRVNIFQATFLAMKKALAAAPCPPDYILVDGKFKIPGMTIPQTAVIKGDSQIFCIAAASIIAKVTRDALMIDLDKKYPQYNFAQHKGYGTKLHLDKIKLHGLIPEHRRSFGPCREKKSAQ